MILRIWHGWTTPENADAYERLVVDDVFPEIAESTGEGYRGAEIARHDDGEEVEFVTIIRFDSWDALEAFAGEDYEEAHVPPEARELLSRFDDEARHYEVRGSA